MDDLVEDRIHQMNKLMELLVEIYYVRVLLLDYDSIYKKILRKMFDLNTGNIFPFLYTYR